jgi:hypothetical protein
VNPRGRERRTFPRARTRSLLGYARKLDHQRFAILGIGSSLDVSASGVRFVAHEAIPIDSRVELELVLDGRAAHVDDARVVRVAALRGGSYEVAVTFEKITPLAREVIRAHVDERIASQRRQAG